MECVPNFSEGRDLDKIEQIVDVFRRKEGVKLLDYSNDRDHNRMVVTAIGEPEKSELAFALEKADIQKYYQAERMHFHSF